MSAVAAIGIDFGTDTIVIGCARKGGVDILDNEVSNRLTPNFVGFGNKVRSIGESGLNEYSRNPDNTVTQLKRFLGRDFDAPDVQADSEMVAFTTERGESGEVLAAVTLAGKERKFCMEACMAMMLTKLKLIIANHVGPIKDVVVSFPGYATAFQRQAVLDAGTIAGLNIVQVMNEHAAAALAWGITKTDLTAESRNVMIVDWGHANLSVSVNAFVKGKLEVLSTAFDRSLGGRDLDKLIVGYFAKEFEEKTKIDLLKRPRPLVKLTAQCQKVKKQLSANPLAPINMECLCDDRDLNSKLEREVLEDMAKSLFERIMPTLEQALVDSGLAKDDLTVVEVTGNMRTVPSFRNAIQEWYGKEIKTTLAADECIAKGSCLQAAILSPAFRVRDFKVVDRTLYPITLVWQPYNATPEQVEAAGSDPANVYDVFERFNVLPSVKMLTFEKIEPFQLVAYYKTPELLPAGTPSCLGTWKVAAVPPVTEGVCISRKIKVKVRLTLHGTLEVDSPQVWDEMEPEIEPPPAPEAEPEAQAEAPAAEAETEAAPEAEAEAEAAPEAEAEAAPEVAPMETEEQKEKKKPKPKTHKKSLALTSEGLPGMTAEKLSALIAEETAMAAADQRAADTDKAMNDFEAYVLATRSKLGDSWFNYVDEASREAFSTQLGDAENWLYDHWDEELEVYVAELDKLTAVGDPIEYRVKEAAARPEVAAATRAVIESVKAEASSTDEKYAHIEQSEKDKVLQECQRVATVLEEKIAAIAEQPKSEKPSCTTGEIKSWGTDLQSFAKPIMSKPKPAPKIEKPKEAEPEAAPEASPEAEGEAAPMDAEDAPPIDPID